MAGTFPALKTGVVGMYPATLGLTYRTDVVQFVNDSEQRWATQPALGEFELTFTAVDGYDLSLVMDFFRSQKGQFDGTWTLTINSNTYNNCTFLDDAFTWTERKAERYDFTLKCRQEKP